MKFEEWWNTEERRQYFDWEDPEHTWQYELAKATWNAAIDAAIKLNEDYNEKPYEVLLHDQLVELKI